MTDRGDYAASVESRGMTYDPSNLNPGEPLPLAVQAHRVVFVRSFNETIVFVEETLFFHVRSLNPVPSRREVRPSPSEACMLDLEEYCSSIVDLSNAHTLGKKCQEES